MQRYELTQPLPLENLSTHCLCALAGTDGVSAPFKIRPKVPQVGVQRAEIISAAFTETNTSFPSKLCKHNTNEAAFCTENLQQ